MLKRCRDELTTRADGRKFYIVTELTEVEPLSLKDSRAITVSTYHREVRPGEVLASHDKYNKPIYRSETKHALELLQRKIFNSKLTKGVGGMIAVKDKDLSNIKEIENIVEVGLLITVSPKSDRLVLHQRQTQLQAAYDVRFCDELKYKSRDVARSSQKYQQGFFAGYRVKEDKECMDTYIAVRPVRSSVKSLVSLYKSYPEDLMIPLHNVQFISEIEQSESKSDDHTTSASSSHTSSQYNDIKDSTANVKVSEGNRNKTRPSQTTALALSVTTSNSDDNVRRKKAQSNQRAALDVDRPAEPSYDLCLIPISSQYMVVGIPVVINLANHFGEKQWVFGRIREVQKNELLGVVLDRPYGNRSYIVLPPQEVFIESYSMEAFGSNGSSSNGNSGNREALPAAALNIIERGGVEKQEYSTTKTGIHEAPPTSNDKPNRTAGTSDLVSSYSSGYRIQADESYRTSANSYERQIEQGSLDAYNRYDSTSHPHDTFQDGRKSVAKSQNYQGNLVETSESYFQLLDKIQVGSYVEIIGNNECGTVKWLKPADEIKPAARIRSSGASVEIYAGVELDRKSTVDYYPTSWLSSQWLLGTNAEVAIVPLNKCRPLSTVDGRIADSQDDRHTFNMREKFGDFDSPQVDEYVKPPLSISDAMCGRERGIQGHHNSCYLDSTLFSMFCFNDFFDEMLTAELMDTSMDKKKTIQLILSHEIIYCLRKYGFVRADHVLKFRELLEESGLIKGLTSEEKDPEEFLNVFLKLFWANRPLLKLQEINGNAVHDTNMYHMISGRSSDQTLPTLQKLFENSMKLSNVRFATIPECLILQLPRSGQDKVHDKTFINLALDITNQVNDFPRGCMVCGKIAMYECEKCNEENVFGNSCSHASFCLSCYDLFHGHPERESHPSMSSKLLIKQGFRYDDVFTLLRNRGIHRLRMNLFAVICIERSHYVAFVRGGKKIDSKWCFFDSMSDREIAGYNIPSVNKIKGLPGWLTNHMQACVAISEKKLPELILRLFSDAYICMYDIDISDK